MTTPLLRRREDGFTLVELLVTMLIVTVGLLGLAKLQAAAVSNSSVARTRALMTFQAESLAGMIRANRGFWVTTGAPTTWPKLQVDADGTTEQSAGMTAVTTCVGTSVSCTYAQLAYDDLLSTNAANPGWAKRFNDGTAASAFPGATAKIECVPASGSGSCTANPTTPHGYDITLTWQQKLVAVNRSTAGTTTQPVSMIMHVQP